jgi:hypothetical protein
MRAHIIRMQPVLPFNTPFTPLRDEIGSLLQFWLNSFVLYERIEQGSPCSALLAHVPSEKGVSRRGSLETSAAWPLSSA